MGTSFRVSGRSLQKSFTVSLESNAGAVVLTIVTSACPDWKGAIIKDSLIVFHQISAPAVHLLKQRPSPNKCFFNAWNSAVIISDLISPFHFT